MNNPTKHLSISLRRTRNYTYFLEIELKAMTRRVFCESLSDAKSRMGSYLKGGAL